MPNLNGGARLVATLEALTRQTQPADVVVVEHLVFVNSDVECEPTFVEAPLERLEGRVGMVAGVLLQRESPGLIDSAGTAVDETLLPFDYLYGAAVETAETAQPPLGPTGGAALYSHQAFSEAGGFDERFFAYLGDVDLALRLRALGFACALAGHARGVHHHSTLGSGSSAKNRRMGWGRGDMLRRYGILREPRRAARALSVEVAICAGQLLVDRNATGVAGRVTGWRAAKGLDRRTYPPHTVTRLSLRDALRVRARRRPQLARLSARP